MSMLNTIIITAALALISASLLSLAKHLNKKEEEHSRPSWAIIDHEYIEYNEEH